MGIQIYILNFGIYQPDHVHVLFYTVKVLHKNYNTTNLCRLKFAAVSTCLYVNITLFYMEHQFFGTLFLVIRTFVLPRISTRNKTKVRVT